MAIGVTHPYAAGVNASSQAAPGELVPGEPAPAEPALALLEILHANWGTQALAVAARLNLPDLLGSGGRTSADLARATGCDAGSLARLLDALVTLNVLARAGEVFVLTAMGEHLRASHPRSLRAWTLWWGAFQWPVWERLMHSVQTGQAARPLVVQAGSWEHLARDAGAAETFHRAMGELTALVADSLVATVDFQNDTHVMDVGGGAGVLLARVLRSAPAARGSVVDLAPAQAAAEAHLHASGLADRAGFVRGDALESVPAGASTYLLKSVLHDFDDAPALRLLRNLHAALRGTPGSRVLVLERLRAAQPASTASDRSTARSDLHMLLAHGGRERTREALGDLLASAGLRVDRTAPLTMALSVLECRCG